MPDGRPHVGGVKAGRLRDIFRQLVDCYSPSGKEHEVVDYTAALLRGNGFPVLLREVPDGRCNVEVVPDPDNLRGALLGHLDTVPAFDVDNYAFQEVDGRVLGLGTADMKGGCAALLEACLSVGPTAFASSRFGLFLVVGEEENGDGTATVLEAYDAIPTALVAEPTDLRICVAHCGYVEMQLRAFGTRRHASMAGREYNAIHALLRALNEIGEFVEENYPETVLNIRDLHSSEAGFAVPDRCVGSVDLHIPPHLDPLAFSAELATVADRVLASASLDRPSETGRSMVDDPVRSCLVSDKKKTPLGRYEVSFPTLARGFRTPADHALAAALRKACGMVGIEPQNDVFRSHSDANLLYDTGCLPIIFGPGQLARAHTRDESVDFRQVVKAAEVYAALLRVK